MDGGCWNRVGRLAIDKGLDRLVLLENDLFLLLGSFVLSFASSVPCT
jgi:hypothetical protein